MADAAIKTGHPWGLIAGLAVKGVDRLGSFMETLQKQLEKYKSLGEVGIKAINQMEQIKKQIESGKLPVNSAAALLDTAAPFISDVIPERLKGVGQYFQGVKDKAEAQVEHLQGLYSGKEFQKLYEKLSQEMLKEAPQVVKMLTQQFKVPKELINVAKDGMSIMMKGENAADCVRKVLENSGYNEMVIEAASKAQAMQVLVQKAPDLIDKLGLVKYKDERGVERQLDKNIEPTEFNQFIKETRLELARLQQEASRGQRFRSTPD
jgi:hypothetical protein